MPDEPLSRRYRRFHRPDPRRDVDEELAFHIAMRVEELVRSGLSEADAREATLRRFGDVANVREECEELGQARLTSEQRAGWRDAVRQDLRFAMRTLWANRGWASLVALTMALGIGANTAIFSLAYGVLLRPLPYADAGALVRLWTRNIERNIEFFSVSPADLAVWRQAPGVFTAVGAFERQRDATLRRGAGVEAVELSAVTPELFQLLGTRPHLGRALIADDSRAGAPRVAVIAHDLWTARFGADSSVVGSVTNIDGAPVTIVGVMPARFMVPGTPALVWTPLDLATATDDHGNRYLRAIGRLAPGLTLDAVRPRLDVVSAQLATDHPSTNRGWSINAVALPEVIVGREFRSAVRVLSGVVAFVLLIACANAANLQLARAASRRGEIALRTAFGAARHRLVRQLLTESLVVGAVAGLAGLALGFAGVSALRTLGDTTVPRLADVRVDTPVLAFTIAITLASAVLFGLLPALRTSRTDPAEVLKGARRDGGAGASHRLRGALVIGEVSLSLVLLIGAGLMVRSLARLQAVDLGFAPSGVSLARVSVPAEVGTDVSKRMVFWNEVLERARTLEPSAALVTSAPFAGPNSGLAVAPSDRAFDTSVSAPDADYRVVSPGYFRTLGIALERGRDFATGDNAEAPLTAIVTHGFAQRILDGGDAIGRTVRVGDVVRGPEFTIVGVVADARYQSLETPEPRPMMYFSSLARPQGSMALVFRGAEPSRLAPGIAAMMAAVDPQQAPPTLLSLATLVGEATATPRLALLLFGLFAGVALVLAVVGVYGVMSYLVKQRTHELGVRLALGASRGRLLGSVVGAGLRLTVVGVLLGLLGARALTGLMSNLLFGISPTDLPTFLGVTAVLLVAATLGSLAPAWRATRADPLRPLRGG